MQNLDSLVEYYKQHHAPTESWTAQDCASSNISIKRDGTWYHDGAPIKRQALVKLFASLLSFDGDGHWLKTPVEKCLVDVEDSAFVIVSWYHCSIADALGLAPCIVAVDNVQRSWPICATYPLQLRHVNGCDVPYLKLDYGLEARVSRNVYYQWVEQLQADKSGAHYLLSAQSKFYFE
ncbi:DUF1285 domain-containing protein [Pseudoalteromonas sp. T1lg65]|uniref:DUF1285 domain-containing protein n=1 Tax=Pseudoalteromonas sp. T1lg65 TaxID=2077101 RepID=UPI003F78C76D